MKVTILMRLRLRFRFGVLVLLQIKSVSYKVDLRLLDTDGSRQSEVV